jgi:putative SOS response-associated peptidase YedK
MHMDFSFLTTDASPDVAPIHPDATPVLLLGEAAREQWMAAAVGNSPRASEAAARWRLARCSRRHEGRHGLMATGYAL